MPFPFRILLVEDDPPSREVMQVLLADAGCEVVACVDGREALAFLGAGAPGVDVVLMDMQLPGVDGVEAVRRMRAAKATRDMPVVCLSARASGRTKAEGLAAGCDVFVTKPCREDRVLEAIDAALAIRGRPPRQAAPARG